MMMTKREFDRATKRGGLMRYEVEGYRKSRLRGTGRDFIAERAWTSTRIGKPAMRRGNIYRAIAAERRAKGEPLLFPVAS